MLLFLADGRLGNQLFQYSFLNSIRHKNESLIVSGFEELDSYFVHEHFFNINKKNRYLRYFVYEIFQKILIFFARIHLISEIAIDIEQVGGLSRESTHYSFRPGIFRPVRFVHLGYFQSDIFFKKSNTATLRLKSLYRDRAISFLQNLPPNTYPIFVHVRRGDYRYHTISGKSTAVPISYYLQAISWFTKHKKNPFFIFLSDEPGSIERDFKHIQNKVISSGNDPGIDLGIMTLCRGGVLSPSSFSWWGSYLMKSRDVVIAPKYWLGFNWGVEYQSGGTPKYAKVIKIC